MSKLAKTATYTALVKDITELCKRAHQAMVECYWQIGRRTVEQEQRGEASTVYARQLIEQLSEDLQQKLGSGFSERNLYRMRQFYLTHKLLSAPTILSWTQHSAHTTTINTHATWQMSFTCLTVRIPKRPMRRGYTSTNNCWTRDWHNSGSHDI
jgi:hypothetical protein